MLRGCGAQIPSRRILLVALSWCFVLMTVGCASDADETQVPQDASAGPRLAAVLADAQGVKTEYYSTRDRLMRKCLVAQGFAVFPSDPTAIPDATTPEDLTPEVAAVAGYGLLPEGVASPSGKTSSSLSGWDATTAEYRSRLSEAAVGKESDRLSYTAEDGAVIGFPGKGCMADADRLMAGDLAAYNRLEYLVVNQMRPQLLAISEKDDHFSEALAAWRACMQDAGFEFAQPSEARGKVSIDYEKAGSSAAAVSEVRQREIVIATADATCAGKVGLPAAKRSADSRAAAVVYPPHQADILAWRLLMSQGLARGQAALAGG